MNSNGISYLTYYRLGKGAALHEIASDDLGACASQALVRDDRWESGAVIACNVVGGAITTDGIIGRARRGALDVRGVARAMRAQRRMAP